MPRFAGIDIGSNSLKMLIANVSTEHGIQPLDFKYHMTKLAAGIAINGRITEKAITRTIDGLRKCLTTANKLEVHSIKAVATAAARTAINSIDLINRVKDEIGLTIEIISGQTEALYTYKAISADFTHQTRDLLIFNIGGGSTELTWGCPTNIYHSVSLPFGAMSLTDAWLSSTDKINPSELNNLCTHVASAIASLSWLAEVPRNAIFIGSGGTMNNIARMNNPDCITVHMSELSKIEIEHLFTSLYQTPIAERRSLPGIEAARADLMVAGASIAWELTKIIPLSPLLVSTRSLSDGLIYEMFLHP